jgi:hypothetical protein
MDNGKARYLTETVCLIACMNRIYGNANTADCITANRLLPCSLCLHRNPRIIHFPPSPLPSGHHPLIPLIPYTPVSSDIRLSTLTAKERVRVEPKLLQFAEMVRQAEKKSDIHGYCPRSSYFSLPTIAAVLDGLLTITTAEALLIVIPRWTFHAQHGPTLLVLIAELQLAVKGTRQDAHDVKKAKSRAAYAAKKAAALPAFNASTTNSHDIQPRADTVPRASHKRPALDLLTNKRAKRPALATVAAVSASYRPQFQPRSRQAIHTGSVTDENMMPAVSDEPKRRSHRNK